MESMQTLSGGEQAAGRAQAGGRSGSLRGWHRLLALAPSLTNVVGLVEDDDGLAGQLLGHQVGNLGVQEVVVAVDHHVGVQDLGAEAGRVSPGRLPAPSPGALPPPSTPRCHATAPQAHRGEARQETQADGQTDTDRHTEMRQDRHRQGTNTYTQMDRD